MKILAVDDKQDILTLVKVILEGHNYEVTTAISGEEAIEITKDENFELILLDLMMGGINGFDTLKEIRKNENYKKTPIIALTAKAQEGDKEKTLEEGFTHYIAKPFRAQELIAEVDSYLKK
jgi:DNA-binding response OmpR family regulator